MSARSILVDALREHVPDGWIVDPPSSEVLTATTVLIEQVSIASFEAAPIRAVEVGFSLELTSEFTDTVGGSRALDDDVVALLVAFRGMRMRFDTATKSTGLNRVSYLTTVYVIASKEPPS